MSETNSSGSNISYERDKNLSRGGLDSNEDYQNLNPEENYTILTIQNNTLSAGEQPQHNQQVENNYSKINKKLIFILIGTFIIAILIIACVLIAKLYLYSEKIKEENEDDNKLKIDLKEDKWDKEYDKELGAYYFAISEKNTDNSKISGWIELPDSVQTFNIRNAYIVFGIEGIKNKINIGLINSGDGWRPFYEVINKEMKVYNEYKNEKNKFVYIQIVVTYERKILVHFIFYDSNKFVLMTLYFEIDASDNLEYKDNKVEVGFFRCISLVPLETVKDDKNDGTYISNGKLSDLKIVKKNQVQPWGISSDNIKYSFKVYPKKVKINYKNSEETFSIFHKN